MNRIITIFLLLNSVNLFSQVTKEVDNGVFVTFPVIPQYQTTVQLSNYVAKTDNCLFMSMVIRNGFPDYPQYVQSKAKMTNLEILEIEDTFLNSVVDGKLSYTDNKGSVTKIKIGKFNGREIQYSAVNPTTGERGKRFSIILLVRDKLVSFECWYLKDNAVSNQEKNSFFNSIKAK